MSVALFDVRKANSDAVCSRFVVLEPKCASSNDNNIKRVRLQTAELSDYFLVKTEPKIHHSSIDFATIDFATIDFDRIIEQCPIRSPLSV